MFAKNKDGFTLLEVIIAITLVAIMVVAFSPVFASILRTYHFNKSRITASNIAQTKLEERRYEVAQGDYDEVGTVSGNPSGSVPQEEFVTKNSKRYKVNTDISWEDETLSDGTVVYSAYKKIEVTAQEVDQDGNKIGPEITHSTNIAREGEREISENGTILVEARTRNSLKSDILISLTSTSPTVNQFGFTDEEGKKIFADLEPNPDPYKYSINADPSSQNMILVPIAKNGSYPNISWSYFNQIQREVDKFSEITTYFEVDWPAYLHFELVDGNDNSLNLSDYHDGIDGLDFQLSFSVKNDFNGNSNNFNINTEILQQTDLDGFNDIKLWPRSEYNVIIENEDGSQRFETQTPITFDDEKAVQTKDLNLVIAGAVNATPNSGEIDEDTEITLSSEPSGFNIYYTKDGSTPTTSSTLYDSGNKPTMTGTSLTIKAIAQKADYFISPVYTFNYTDDD